MPTEHSERLGRITSALLDPEGSFGSWRDASIALYHLFTEIAPLAPNEVPSADHDETMLPDGKAISTVDAARCILDFQRTRTFLIGVERAIRSAERRPAHVLYAGTGPFAPLVVPLMTVFDPDELQVTLLDIHPSSVDRLHATIEAFDLGSYVRAVHLADATTFVVPEAEGVDVLVSETMQRALTSEPYVAIVCNLLRQLPASVTLVPQRVTISASMSIPGSPDSMQRLGDILVFDAELARDDSGGAPPCRSVTVDRALEPGAVLTLDTRLTVCEGVEIGDGGAGLCIPLHLTNPRIERDGSVIDFVYRLGSEPGFVASIR